MEFNINWSDGFLEVEMNGKAQYQEFESLLSNLVEHKNFKPGSSLLVNLSELSSGHLKAMEIPKIAEYCVQLKEELGEAKCAVVAPRHLDFGFSRLWQDHVHEQWDVREEVFRSRKEALLWLSPSVTN